MKEMVHEQYEFTEDLLRENYFPDEKWKQGRRNEVEAYEIKPFSSNIQNFVIY